MGRTPRPAGSKPKARWLHISDFHFRGGDPYDRDVVLHALVKAIRRFRDEGLKPDLVFATGDVAHAGRVEEYKAATDFFDAVCKAADIDRQHLFVIAGNHDVDRDQGLWLARTLNSREEADRYFRPGTSKLHITNKLGAFVQWYNGYFEGIRSVPLDTTCGPVEAVDVRGFKIGVLPLNSAPFCQDDHDHAKLWIGRRCLDAALEQLDTLGAALNVALVHHPLDWLSDTEASNIKTALANKVDVVLRGHLHQTDVESVAGVSGQILNIAAGAAYQTRLWPNRALYTTIDGNTATIFPIRYEDQPQEVWVIDPSVFPTQPKYEGKFPIARLSGAPQLRPEEHIDEPPPVTAVLRRFQSNIRTRRNLPFVGRDDLLKAISDILADPARESIVVLHGQPGVGKSEIAREYARRNDERYPGGTFFIDAGSDSLAVELANIGRNWLDLEVAETMPLQDQGLQTLRILGEAPSLIIYDNVRSEDSTRPWLPPSGMPCHVVITTVLDRWDGGWAALTVEPLTEPQSLELVEKLAGRELAARHGRKLADIAGGLPAQLVPASVTLAYEARRGRSDAIPTTLQHEATQSFRGTYEQLETPARLLLLSAARLNPQRILRSELQQHLMSAAGWSETEFQRNLDACLDVHVLQGADTLRMHQLFASFLLATDIAPDVADTLSKVEASQIGRVAEIAQELGTAPNRANLAATFMTYPLTNDGWMAPRLSTEDGEAVGRALANVGQFVAAQPWFQRAAAAKEKGAAQGQSDHDSLGSSLHWIGFCLSGTGKFAEAQPWYERAVAAREKGDVQGLIDHDGMSASLHQVGLCLSSTGKFAEAQPWYERAVAAAEKGDRHGQVDHDSIGLSLQEVGWCLSSTGKFAEAQLWFERSVAAREKGDRHGRLNHDGIGLSLHQVGFCLSSTGKFAEAQPWFERAVTAREKGDRHGRLNHDGIGVSLHQVGFCLSSAHNYAEARPWFERAVAAREKGDVHGRLDHDGIGRSMHQVGVCISETATFAEAQPWYERAVTAKEKGDVHGRIDHNSLGNSLHSIGFCLSSMQKFVEAQPWYERAVAAREKGDVHGRIDHNSLGITLHLIGFCLFSTQKFAAAQPWFERAAAAKEMGDLYGRRDPASLALTLRSWASCLDKLGVVAEKARELRERAVAINPPAS